MGAGEGFGEERVVRLVTCALALLSACFFLRETCFLRRPFFDCGVGVAAKTGVCIGVNVGVEVDVGVDICVGVAALIGVLFGVLFIMGEGDGVLFLIGEGDGCCGDSSPDSAKEGS